MPVSCTGTTSLVVPPTQNTAPVHEYNCLYTHDIRRKTKRWQDGILRYHTFNKRVMVYDTTRNFIGDTHLTATADLHEDDEVRLEKGGIIVQVSDKIGQTETDLTDLRKSKNKTTSNPASSSPLRLPAQQSGALPPRQALQTKHRSLNTLLGAARTSVGKAVVPTKSPFDLRQESIARKENEDWTEQGREKRRRVQGDTKSCVSVESTRKTSSKKHKSKEAEHIDLCSDNEESPLLSSINPTIEGTKSGHKQQSSKGKSFARHRSAEHQIDTRVDDTRFPPPSEAITNPSCNPTLSNHQQTAISTSKKLSLSKTTSRRSLLACQSTIDSDFYSRHQNEQARLLTARLERLRHKQVLPTSISSREAREQSSIVSLTRDEQDLHSFQAADTSKEHEQAIPQASMHTRKAEILQNAKHITSSSIQNDSVHHIGSNIIESIKAPITSEFDLANDEIEAFDNIPELVNDSRASETTIVNTEIEECSAIHKGLQMETVDQQESMLHGDISVSFTEAMRTSPSEHFEHPRPPTNTSAPVDRLPNTTKPVMPPPSRSEEVMTTPADLEYVQDKAADDAADSTEAYNSTLQLAVSEVISEEPVKDPIKPQITPVAEAAVVITEDTTIQVSDVAKAAKIDRAMPRRRLRGGVGRLEIRKSAASCFKPPTLTTRTSTDVQPSVTTATAGQVQRNLHSLGDTGAWSREAFDLFTWRPPDWNEETWCTTTPVKTP